MTTLADLRALAHQAWRDDAACLDADPEMFFPDKGETTGPAKQLCARCPVADPCRTQGIHHETWGVWGGLAAGELKRERARLGIHLEGDTVPRPGYVTVDLDRRRSA